MVFTNHVTINTGDDWSAANHNLYCRDDWNFYQDTPGMTLLPTHWMSTISGGKPTESTVETSAAGQKPAWKILSFSAVLLQLAYWNNIPHPDFDPSVANPAQVVIWWYGSAQADEFKVVDWVVLSSHVDEGDDITGIGYNVDTVEADNLSLVANVIERAVVGLTFDTGGIKAGLFSFFAIGRDGTTDDAVGAAKFIQAHIEWDWA